LKTHFKNNFENKAHFENNFSRVRRRKATLSDNTHINPTGLQDRTEGKREIEKYQELVRKMRKIQYGK